MMMIIIMMFEVEKQREKKLHSYWRQKLATILFSLLLFLFCLHFLKLSTKTTITAKMRNY